MSLPASSGSSALHVRRAHLDDLSPRTLYGLLRLRVDVFVVEQECAYPELDGADLDPMTEHLWLEVDGEVVSTLRITSRDGWRIGRVATAPEHRGRGYAARLMHAALEANGDHEVRLEAQAHLEQWYTPFGFVADGAEYLEDGIPHLPMRRPR